jgi:hypothetical protein
MTETEVEEILGKPGKGWHGSRSMIGKAWISDEGLIAVYFGRANGTVVSKEFTPFPRRSIFQRIIRWLSGGYSLAGEPVRANALNFSSAC